ncbi:MAG TPA: hypothetical protein VLK84_20230 [Longimicrobium sp.]|nr:hypothetical protein [Longimicrobium sp.]
MPSSVPPGPWRAARRDRGLLARLAVPAGLVGLLLGTLLALPTARPGGAPEPVPAPGYDPRRIAVLYFDDNSDGGELGWIANGLTEMLIHTLSQVGALDVISRNGVKPYRDDPVLFDSMVADLRVGSVVEGSVQRSGDSVRVTVQLIDANTNSHLESHTVAAPLAGVFALEDTLAARVSELLRRRLGHEIQLRQTRAETGSEEAWRWTWQAEQARDEALRLAGTGEPLDAASAGRRLLQADSLLARAEAADPRWTRPVVLRGWVAYRRALLPGARAAPLLGSVRRQADRVLAREPANAAALELRGTLLLRQGAEPSQGEGQDARLQAAERDLRAAVAADPSLATAWRTLSLVLRYRGSVAESDMAARRALAEDAYLDDADDILHRLAISALLLKDYAGARALCDQLHRAPPGNRQFLECRLTLLRDDPAARPDPAEALRLAAELDRVDPAARGVREGRAYSPVFRLAVAAAVLARAGQADGARSLLARARAAAGADPELHLSLGYDEAVVLLLLGERGAARERLDQVLARRPALRPFASRDPLLRELFTPAR